MIEDPHLLRMDHLHPSILAMEDHVAAQQREIQTLLADNHHLAATNVALKQDLSATQNDLRTAAAAAANARDHRDAEVRETCERSLKAEADVHAIDRIRAELAQVKADVQKLRAARDGISDRKKKLVEDLDRARKELARSPEVRAEVEAMHKEIQRARAAVDYEKAAHARNLELSETMEKNMVTMARDIEKLRGELANTEKRARARAAAAAAASAGNLGQEYGRAYGKPEMAYGTSASAYSDTYYVPQAQQRGAGGGSQYGMRGTDDGSQYVLRGTVDAGGDNLQQAMPSKKQYRDWNENQAADKSIPSNTLPNDFCYKCGREGHWSRTCLAYKENANQVADKSIPSNTLPKDICYKCGREGHWSRTCLAYKENTNQPADMSSPSNTLPKDICYKCGREGHWSRTCLAYKENANQAADKSITSNSLPKDICYKCGREGHRSRTCHASKKQVAKFQKTLKSGASALADLDGDDILGEKLEEMEKGTQLTNTISMGITKKRRRDILRC